MMPYDMQQQPMAQPGAAGQGQLDPQLVDAILALQRQGPQQNAVQRSLKLAEQMRADAGNQMQTRRSGVISSPPTVLNAVANLYGRYKAKGIEDDAMLRQQNMGAEQQAAMRRYFDAMTNRKQAPLPYMGAEGE